MKEGWVCPKCGKVLAPFMPYCDCYEKEGNKQTIYPNTSPQLWSKEEVFNIHEDTGGNYHFTGTHTGKHTIRKESES